MDVRLIVIISQNTNIEFLYCTHETNVIYQLYLNKNSKKN